MRVKLHSNETDTAEATDATLKMLPGGGGFLKRDTDGKIEFDDDGCATIITPNPDFMKFAVKKQGYVAEVVD